MPTPEEVKQYGLKVGEYIRLNPTGPVYKVETVNHSRAYCLPIKKKTVKVRTLDPETGLAVNREFDKTDDGISIAVMSLVTRVTEAEALASVDIPPKRQTKAKEDTMGASAIPVAGSSKSAREREKDRRSSRASKREARAAAVPGARRVTREKAPRTVRKCFCGCGEETMSYFVPGHDARFNGWMKKIASGKMEVDELKKSVRDAVGPWKKKGDGMVPSKDYKGNPYKGAH